MAGAKKESMKKVGGKDQTPRVPSSFNFKLISSNVLIKLAASSKDDNRVKEDNTVNTVVPFTEDDFSYPMPELTDETIITHLEDAWKVMKNDIREPTPTKMMEYFEMHTVFFHKLYSKWNHLILEHLSCSHELKTIFIACHNYINHYIDKCMYCSLKCNHVIARFVNNPTRYGIEKDFSGYLAGQFIKYCHDQLNTEDHFRDAVGFILKGDLEGDDHFGNAVGFILKGGLNDDDE